MTTQATYSPAEWVLIRELPLYVTFAVIQAGPGDVRHTQRELRMLVRALAQEVGAGKDAELIHAVLRDAASPESPDEIVADGLDDPRTAALAAPDVCRQVADILAAKSNPTEALSYKRWVLWIGGQVAEAAREGSFLRLGRPSVSAEEVALLDRLTLALGIVHTG